MRYIIKWRFLLKLAVALFVAAVVIHFTHRWQVGRQVGAFLYQADLARDAAEREEKAGERVKATAEREREQTFLRRYVLARPDDMDARDRLGRLMCQNAKTKKQLVEAFFVLEDILRRDPKRDDLRRFAIDFAMRLLLFKEAQGHIRELIKDPPIDGELEGLLARCLVAEKNFPDAEEHYKRSISKESMKKPIDSYAGLAFVRRQMKKPQNEADAPIATMLGDEDHKDNARAYLVAAVYLREFGLPELTITKESRVPAYTPDELIKEALQRAPNDLDVLITAADMARARSRELARDPKTASKAPQAIQEARDLLTQATKEHPDAPAPYRERAKLEADVGQVSEALKILREGLQKIPDSVELALGLLEYQFLNGDAAGAAETLKTLRDRGLSQDVADFENARVAILNDDWRKAAQLLESAAGELQLRNKSEYARQANLLLGRCYEQLGDNQRRYVAYTKALPLSVADALWAPAMQGIAEAETALGRVSDALKTYRKLTDQAPAMWISVARLELNQALRAPASKPDWSLAEEAISKAEQFATLPTTAKRMPDSADIGILRATIEHYKGKPEKARETLEVLRTKRPKDVAVRIELAMQALREQKLPEANATLDEAAKDLGDSLEVRLARARLWVAAKAADLPAKLTSLTANTDKFTVAQKRRLLRGLAEIATSAGAEQAANQLWVDLAGAKPFDVSVQLVRFDRATRAGDIAAMEQILNKIEEIEGQNGPSTRLARAVLKIQQSQAKNDRALRDQALRILEDLEREQGASTSGRALLAQAIIHDQNGDRKQALKKYWQAIDRNEINPQAIDRMIELLTGPDGDWKQAYTLIDKLQNVSELGTNSQRRMAEVSLREGNYERALEFAKRAAQEDSTNYKDQLWLGGIYSSLKDKGIRERAKDRFGKATELAPEVTETWLALMQYYAAAAKAQKAAEVFGRAQEKVKKSDRTFFLALGNALLGETTKAVDAFKAARMEQPNEPRILLAEADYLLQLGRLTDARTGFQRVLSLPSASADEKDLARQRYAVALAADPELGVSKEALKLIGEAPSGGETPAQRRARALILALQKDRASKLEAIRLLEENEVGRTASDQFMLAQLHNQVGNRLRVPVVMADLLKTEKNRIPLYVRFYAGWLIREKFFADAEEQVKVLEKIDPNSLSTAELKARLAVAKKDIPTARKALLSKVDDSNAPIGFIARICEDVGLYEDAERLLKQFVDQNKEKHPSAVLSIAAYYGRRGRTAEALQICDDVRGKLPWPNVGLVAVDVLYHASTPAIGDMARVAAWLVEAAKRAEMGDRATLLQCLAAVRNLQGDYAAAIQLYKDVLVADSRDLQAMNNLGYLLSAFVNDHEAGLGLIEQAKKLKGEHPTLLDTEALIRLNMNQPQQALKLLEVVVAEAPSGPGYYHLVQAELALKHDLEARRAWRRAQEIGLKIGDLHPLERKEYERISQLPQLK